MMTFEIDQETGKIKSLLKVPPYHAFAQRTMAEPDNSKYQFTSLEEQGVFSETNPNGVPMQCPLSMRINDSDEWWRLPYEPIITVNGKNVIAKKQVAKGKVRGTIKERWSQDDYMISIQGILINPTGTGYPDEDVKQMRRFCEAAKVKVLCPLFELFSITQIVIESYDFPFTSGPNNQGYTISAVSDDIYKLLLREEDLKVQ